MNSPFTLSCESTIDLPYTYAEERNLPILFYNYSVDGVDYVDDMLRDPEALPRFYQMLNAGKMPTTSQINSLTYKEYFEKLLEKGDLLHVTLGTGMTKSFRNAVLAAEELRAAYPSRKITIIDSMCSSSGYGLLIDRAADMRDAGASMDDIEAELLAVRQTIHHQFFSTDLKHFRRSGRVSGPAAMLGTVLGICPIMRLDDKGKIIAYSKVRGKHTAIKTTLDEMELHAIGGASYNGKCFICHSNCPEDAEKTKQAIMERFPNVAEPRICDIGTIIASHCGPGTVAVFFFGDERAPE